MRKKIILLIIICVSLFLVSVGNVILSYNNRINLAGRVIYLDAGHGGKDNGASFDGVLEDEINLKIVDYIVENLIELGSYVLVSRTGDYDLSNVYDKNKKFNDLKRRVGQINKSKVDLFVSVHLNSYSSDIIKGPQVFYQNNSKSRFLANSIQYRLNFLCDNCNRKVKLGDYYLLNNTNRTGVIVECGFLSNYIERNLLIQKSYQEKVAMSITGGIVDYFTNYVE